MKKIAGQSQLFKTVKSTLQQLYFQKTKNMFANQTYKNHFAVFLYIDINLSYISLDISVYVKADAKVIEDPRINILFTHIV